MTVQTDYPDGFPRETCPGSLNVIVEEALAKFPGAIDSYIIAQTKRVADQFFRRSLCWRSLLGPYSVAAGQDALSVNPADSYSRMCMVLGVLVNGRPIFFTDAMTAAQTISTSAVPFACYTEPYDILHFTPAPSSPLDAVVVNAALVPIWTDATVPEWVIEQHYDALLVGLFARMYGEPAKPYTSMSLYESNNRRFRAEIATARITADLNYTRSSRGIKFPPWA